MPWIYEADVHCDACAALRFGPPEGEIDGEGNPVSRMPADDPLRYSLCGTCREPVEMTLAECVGYAWGRSVHDEWVMGEWAGESMAEIRHGHSSEGLDDDTWEELFWEGFTAGQEARSDS